MVNSAYEVRLHIVWLVVAVSLFFCAVYFREGLSFVISSWSRDEYSHIPMIPLVAGFLFFQRIPHLELEATSRHFVGPILLFAGLVGWVLGELSSIYTILQYSFVVSLWGLVVAALGWPRSKLIWASLLYLLFMIPLPNFLYANLSQQMQLLSSEIGVAFIRFFQISVFLEGNVIDLGNYKLQVVEACSGLNYLFPLMSFGFLLAYLFQAPVWQRLLLFLSTIPITILMNSIRIGIIGLLVEHYGIGMAEGFLHWFEGWVIFVACVALLLTEIKLLLLLFRSNAAGKSRVFAALDLSWPDLVAVKQALNPVFANRYGLYNLLVCMLLLVAFIPAFFALKDRQEVALPRSEFVAFPMFYKDWVGRQGFIQADVLTSLRLSDHIVADYRVSGNGLPVNLYVAYYDSQRKGASVHSPRSCIPGGGWEIQSLARKNILLPAGSAPLAVNRVLIQKGNARRLVYYWFQQRGRVITDEYAAKWYIFWDGLTRNRTDGALVRVTVPVSKTQGESDADEQLVRFIRDFKPLISQFIPD